MSEFNKYPPEIQQQRNQLAQEIKSVRGESAAKRKDSKSLKSRVTGRSDRLVQEAGELKESAKDRLQKGKEAIDLALERSRLGLQDLESVSTDHNLIRWYYKHLKGQEVHPVATDTFIDKSRDEYNAAWLSRELVQNFIDHNPKAPGTLNGVSINKEQLPSGKIRFNITGEWPFPDPTGIISPHSEKPADTHTAGGNGIGLKQTAIRYLRDFGVSRFEIDGESWVANYQLANAAEMNGDIEKAFQKAKEPVARSMRHDWLIADLKTNGSHGRCSYIIETDNPEVIVALDQFENLGVCDKNEYLKDPDFSNKQGAIKWLPPRERQEGRLFINGQVMNYGSKGKTAKDYWVGPEYVTVQLNDIAYKMSVDRPPVQSYELGMYLSHLVGSMTVEEVMDQIKRAEPIWTIKDISDRVGAMVVIDKLIGSLKYNSKYDKKQYEQYFGDKKYLAKDHRLTDAQIEDLEKQGYVLCPASFEYIGMPKASSKLSNLEMAASQQPDTYRANSGLEKIAEESGIQVAFEDLDSLKPEQLFVVIQKKIADNRFEVISNPDRPSTIRIRLNIELSKELLSRALPKPKTDTQKLLYFFRGVAFAGLDKNILKRIYLAQGDYVTTFGTQYDSALEENTLFARNLKATTDQGVFVEMELADEFLHLKDILVKQGGKEPSPATLVGQPPKPLENIAKGEPETDEEPEKPDLRKEIPVIIKEKEQVLSEAQLDELDGLIPGIKSAIQKLQEVADKTQTGEGAGEKSRTEKYKEWRDSAEANKLAEESAGYVTGKTIEEIVTAYNEAEIAVVKEVGTGSEEDKAISELVDLKQTLQSAINKMNPDGEVQDFEMVFDPKPRQLAQLGLLRIYAYLTTGVSIKNKLFAFRGTGVTGINMQREAIGLHEKELDQSFLEAAGIFTHELAHNEHMDHDVGFMTTMEALFLETQRKLTEIALKAKKGEDLNENEELILSVVEKWDELRSQE